MTETLTVIQSNHSSRKQLMCMVESDCSSIQNKSILDQASSSASVPVQLLMLVSLDCVCRAGLNEALEPVLAV